MEENRPRCFGCLVTEDEFSLEEFPIKCEPLKAIFQGDRIKLCYICNRLAQHTELFIQNVQHNQILLETFQGALSSSEQSIRDQVQSSITLSRAPLTTIVLNDTADDDKELSTNIINKELMIELEPKFEGMEHLVREFIDGNDDMQESLKADENDLPLDSLLTEEIDLDNIDLKSLQSALKCKKVLKKEIKIKEKVKKRKRKFRDIPKIYTKMHLSVKQFKKESQNRAQQTSYLSCTFKCKGCIKGFIIRSSFEKHMKKHDKSNGNFRCPICTLRYDTAGKLKTHKLCHTLRYKCTKCEFICSSYTTIKEHFSAKHSTLGYFELKCPHCPKVFSRAISLRKHKNYRHSGDTKVICEICNKKYATKESLKAHLLRKHLSDSSYSSLVKRYECQECGMGFKAPSQLRNHKTKHSEVKPFYCVECDRSFKTAASLSHHLKTTVPHVNKEELPLQCQHCDKRFANKRDVSRHTNRVHLNIKPYSCDKCDRTYINNWSLIQHKRYTHDGVKRPLRYPCTMCDKIFDRNSIRKSHMRTHTGERPYQCTRCSATFAQGSALGTHVKLIHLRLTRDGKPKTSVVK